LGFLKTSEGVSLSSIKLGLYFYLLYLFIRWIYPTFLVHNMWPESVAVYSNNRLLSIANLITVK
jgi:hypothetical protein